MIKLKKKIKETKKKNREKTYYKKASSKEKTGIIHIKARTNNVIFTLTDLRGNTLSTITGGILGYKNAQKSTWTTVRECANAIGKKAREWGYTRLYINLRGFCAKRGTAYRGIRRARCKIEGIVYQTALPHNGCRVFKKRRK